MQIIEKKKLHVSCTAVVTHHKSTQLVAISCSAIDLYGLATRHQNSPTEREAAELSRESERESARETKRLLRGRPFTLFLDSEPGQVFLRICRRGMYCALAPCLALRQWPAHRLLRPLGPTPIKRCFSAQHVRGGGRELSSRVRATPFHTYHHHTAE